MKNYRKIVSIILTICMVMQILPVFAAEAAEAVAPVGFVYLINDDFGADNTANWSLDVDSGKSLSGTDVSYMKSVEVPGDAGNYMLEYTAASAADAQYSHISKVLDNPAVFATGKDVVIETRLKQTGSGRSFLKMNLVSNPSSTDEWNNNYGTLLANDNGTVSVLGSWYAADHATAPNWNPLSTVATGATNVWYNIKITIKGATKTADYEITPDGGSTITKTNSIDYPDAAGWVEDQLNTVDFRLRNANTLYIDYVRAYELMDADMSTASIITPADDVVVTINAAEGNEAFADALALYDEKGKVVETTNTIDSTNMVVTLAPGGMLKEGGKYTVKLDTDAVATNYSFASTEKQIVVSDIKYYIYDDFGKDDLNGWEAKKFEGKNSTNTAVTEPVEEGSGNYMLTYTAADTNNSYYGYLSKALGTAAAFSTDKDIVIEARMKQTGAGRAFIKYNLDGTSYSENEWEHNWGTLVENNKSTITLMNGWLINSDNLYKYPSGFGGTAEKGDNNDVLTGTDTKNNWFTYKIVIHGGTAGENHTATGNTADYYIYDANGTQLKERKGFDIDFPDNSNWANVNVAGATDASWVEDALNSVDFKLRQAETLNIDYVKVYEVAQREAQLNIESGKYVKFDEDIIFNITTEATDLFMPSESVVFTNASGAPVEADTVYDKVAKTFTVNPDANLEIGEVYTLTFTDNEFVAFKGTNVFTVEAREYTTGLIINDTFDSEASATTLEGWVANSSKALTYDEGVTASKMLEVVKDPTIGDTTYNGTVLKLSSNANNVNKDSGAQIWAFRQFDKGVEFKEGKKITIKTKVYQDGAPSDGSRFDLRFNRPNTAAQASGLNDHQWLQYGIFRQSNDTASYAYSFGSDSYPNITPISNLKPSKKWVEYTIVLDGVAQKMDITAVTTDGTYTAKNVMFDLSTIAYEDIYGKGATTDNSYVKTLESLTFKNTTADAVYIDYIQVYEEFDAEMLVNGTYAPDEAVTVTFKTQEGSAALADAVVLYGADGGVVETTNTIDSTNKVVTLAHDGLTKDAKYTVKLDMTKVPVNYVFTKTQASFTASDVSYYIYDEFGEDDLNGWEAKMFEGKTSTNTAITEEITGDPGNYMLTYTTTNANNSYYGYLSKTLTPVEITEGKSVVIEARMKQTGTGRSFLKYNLDGTSYYENEWQHNWGTLVQNDKGKVSVIKGWVYTSAGVYGYPKGFGVSDAAGDNLNVVTDTANKWYTYKVILHGGETKNDVTADYIIYDANGEQLEKLEGLAIDFPDNSNWADVTAGGATNASWVEGVLNSVDFRLRDAETLNIDYVKVYEMGIAQVTLANGRYNKYDEPIVLNVAAEGNGVIIPNASVVLKNGDDVIETTAEYDAEAGTLTVNHTENLATDGTVYTLTLKDSDYVHFTGTTSFEIEGRGEYQTVAIDDDFDDGTDGWAAGVSNIATTVEQDTTTFASEGKKVLKIVSTDSKVKNADGYQPVAYKKLGNGFKVTAGKDIVIKTSIYQTADNMGRFDLKFNRPNSATQVKGLNDYTWMSYNLLRQADNKASLPSTFGADNFNYGVDFADLNPVGKWVDYTLTIDGTNKTFTATAVADNKTYTAVGVFDLPKDAFEAEYGIGGTPAYVQAINSLTFKNTTANSPVYVDYVKVYDNLVMVSADIDGEIVELGEETEVYATGYEGDFSEYVKLYSGETEVAATKSYNSETGTVSIKPATAPTAETTYKLVLDLPAGYDYTGSNEFTVTHKPAGEAVDISFNDGIADWSATNNRISGEIKTEGENNYLSVSASDILNSEADKTSFTYSMPLDFMMDADGYTVLEAKIRATGLNYRKMLRLNADFTAAESAKTTNTPWQINYSTGKVSSTYFCYSNDVENGVADVMGDYTEGKWYTVRTIYDNVNRMVSFVLLDENGNLISRRTDRSMTGGYGENEDNPAAWWFNYKNIERTDREKMRYIDNIALSLRSNVAEKLTTAETFDIDDIKLYNTEDVSGLTGFFEVSIVDENGNDVTGEEKLPEAGGTFKTKVNYSLGTSKSFSVITALYNEGKLEVVKTKSYTDVTSAIEDVNEITIDSGVDRSIKVFVWDSVNSAVPLMAPVVSSGTESVKLYVSTNGNDTNDGSKDAPVASLTAAQEIAKTYNEDVTVLIEDGEYFISEPINLNHNGKADAKVTYKAVGDNADFIGGIVLPVNNATQVTDETILGRLVDAGAKDYLYEISLEGYDIPDAALPGIYSHTYLNDAQAPGLENGDGTYKKWVTEPETTCEVFLEDEVLTIARYPNKDDKTVSKYPGYMTVETIVNAGAAPRNWRTDSGDDLVAYDDRNINDVFKIGYTDGGRFDKWADAVQRANNGADKDRPIMSGFWRWDWATQSVPIANIDAENNVVTSKYPSTYGMLIKTGTTNTPASDRRFYVFNLLEEIDQRGEYFIDRTNKKLYFYRTDDMAGKRLIISADEIDRAFNVTGAYTTIDGINVTAFNGTGIRAAGDYITVQNCNISNTTDWAATVSGTNVQFLNNSVKNVNGGVYVSGGSVLAPANHLVDNNTFENFSRIDKINVPAIQLSGVGNTVKYNEIFNSEHSAIMFGGVNNTIMYNNIHDVLKESDDAGAIYAGRSWTTRGNVIKYNYIHDLESNVTGNEGTSPIAGIFLDDHLAGAYIEGNIFEDIKGDGIRGNGGREHTITNNIFVNCSLHGTAMGAPATTESKFSTQEKGVQDIIDGSEAELAWWRENYPILFTTDANGATVVNMSELMLANGHTYTKNFAAGCGSAFDYTAIPSAQLNTIDFSTNNNVSTDVFGGNYSDIASKVTGITGFAQIPFASIRPTTAEQ